MKKHTILGIIIMIIFIIIPAVVQAATFLPQTVSFGGKVLTTSIPDIDCYSTGTGPIVLVSNLTSLAAGAASQIGNQSTVNRVSSGIASLYGAIPYYASEISITADNIGGLFVSTPPKKGDWILGRANTVPNFNTCYLNLGAYQIPFPVKPTNNYRTSGTTSAIPTGF